MMIGDRIEAARFRFFNPGTVSFPAAWSTCRRCRYDQHRRQKTSLTIEGSLVTGLVHSVMEAKASNPKRWIITVIAEPSIAA